MNRLVNATIHSLRGLKYSIANETAVRQEAITLGLAILLGFSLSPDPAWYVALIGVLLVLLAVELLNTAIEKLSDHVTPSTTSKSVSSRMQHLRPCSACCWSPSWYGSWRFRCVSDFFKCLRARRGFDQGSRTVRE